MPTATVATTQSEEKTQGTPTVVSLSSIAPLDVKAQVLQIDTWLQGTTGKNLKHIQHGASIPMVANIFALTGSVLDLIAVSKSAAKPGSNPLGYGYLALNLIGYSRVQQMKPMRAWPCVRFWHWQWNTSLKAVKSPTQPYKA